METVTAEFMAARQVDACLKTIYQKEILVIND
jgi:hypothetical protein